MHLPGDSAIHARLARQSLGRPLTEDEQRLAAALEAIFATGEHELSNVARLLDERQVRRPSGSAASWTVASLEEELRSINDSLDAAYRGCGSAP